MKNKCYSKVVSIFSLAIAIATFLWFTLPATLCYAQGGYGGGGGGGAIPAESYPGFTSLSGSIGSTGVIIFDVTAESADNKCQLTIESGTKATDKTGVPLTGIIMTEMTPPPSAPVGSSILGLTYNLGPDGATFTPAISLTFNYDPTKIPTGVNEKDLVLAFWDGTKWVNLTGPFTIDLTKHTITAPVSHFTAFTIIATVPPPPTPPTPPAPPTPPEPTAPAAFSVSNLTVQPKEVQPKAAVTITTSVSNTGGTEGSYTVVLNINGVKEAEKSVTVAAGSSNIVTFSVTKETAGSYSVTVDSLSASFTVAAPPVVIPPIEEVPTKPATNWWLIGGIIAGVIIIAVGIWLLVVRQRA